MIGTPRTILAIGLAALAVGAGACGDDEGDEDATSSTSTEATGSAEIDPGTGDPFEDILEPDERQGTPPPEIEIADLEEAAADAGCDLQLDLEDEGNTHIAEGGSEPSYETDPPTSGDHSPTPLADGAYLDTPEAVNYVHSLEHGRVEIIYSPDLPEDEQLALKGIFDEDPDGMLLFPDPEMPYAVAATAWTNLLGCDTYSAEALDAIRAFRDEFRGNGPEDIPL